MIHLDLQPEVEARLAMQAQARGLALNSYLNDLMSAHANEPSPESPADAVAQIRELRKDLSLDGLSIRELINEGRKY